MATKKVIRFVQQQLLAQGYSPGAIDGDYGPKTLASLQQVPGLDTRFSKKRKLIAFIQMLSHQQDGVDSVKIDGYWGPQTEHAFEQLEYFFLHGVPQPTWRPEDRADRNPNHWPSQQSEQQLIEFYGQPGENLVTLDLPYEHRLSWAPATRVGRTQCHQKVADSLGRVLADVLSRYGEQGIRDLRLDRYGGCFSNRSMRGGSRKSMHSWGIALDYDPDRNRLNWGRNKASFARPDYDEWWDCWEKEGWLSLGRSRNFDWMHVQAAKL